MTSAVALTADVLLCCRDKLVPLLSLLFVVGPGEVSSLCCTPTLLKS